MPTSIQEKIEKQVATQRAARKRGSPRSKAPVPNEFFDACLSCPTARDLAGFYGVTKKTIYNWFKSNDELQAVWDRAKALDAAELLAVARAKALAGSHQHWRSYLGAVRPDLIAPDSNVSITNNKTTVKVLGKPPKQGRPKPFKPIEGEATEVYVPNQPEKESSGLPLFGGKVVRPQ